MAHNKAPEDWISFLADFPQSECPELPSSEQPSLNDTRQTWPYSQPVVCCALPDRPFELKLADECTTIGATVFHWPVWESEHGCVRPSSRIDEDPPVCCFFMDTRYLHHVQQQNYSDCISSGTDVFRTMPMSWCAAPTCISGLAADNYPNGFRTPGGDVWLPFGADTTSTFRQASQIFLVTGVTALLVVVFSCCFVTAALIVRSILLPQRRLQPDAVLFPGTRSEVSFTAIDTFIDEAELMPDVVPGQGRVAGAPVATSCIPEEDGATEDGTTDVVFVVMPDSTMHLGQGDEDAVEDKGAPAVQPGGEKSASRHVGSGDSEATPPEQLENENQHSVQMNSDNRGVGGDTGRASSHSHPHGEVGQEEEPEVFGSIDSDLNLNAAEDETVASIEATARERCSSSVNGQGAESSRACLEMVCIRQQSSRDEQGLASSSAAEGIEAVGAHGRAVASASAACESSGHSMHAAVMQSQESWHMADEPVESHQ